MKLTFHGHRPAFLQTQALNASRARPDPESSAPTAAQSQPAQRPVQKLNMGFFKIKIHRDALTQTQQRRGSSSLGSSLSKPESFNSPSKSAENRPSKLENNTPVNPPTAREEFQKILKDFEVGIADHFDEKTTKDEKLEAWKWRTEILARVCLRHADSLNLTPDDLFDLKRNFHKPQAQTITPAPKAPKDETAHVKPQGSSKFEGALSSLKINDAHPSEMKFALSHQLVSATFSTASGTENSIVSSISSQSLQDRLRNHRVSMERCEL